MKSVRPCRSHGFQVGLGHCNLGGKLMGGAVGPKNESRLMERVKLSKALMYVSVVLGEGVGLKVEERPSRGLILVRGRDCLAEGGRRS